MELSDENNRRINELIEVCKNNQGERIPGHHGSGSWATTYSRKFTTAAAEIYMIYESCSYGPLSLLSERLRGAGILSCRRAIMNDQQVKYLYQKHLMKIISEFK